MTVSALLALSGRSPQVGLTEMYGLIGKMIAYKASLSLEAVQLAISKAKSLIAGFGERFETTPVGGHGLS